MVEVAFFRDCAVDAFEDLFADFTLYIYIYIYIYVLNKVILFNIYIEQSYFTASPNLRCLLCRRRLYCGGRWTQIGKKDVISKRLRVYCLVTIPKFLPFYSWIKYFNLLSSSWRYKCLIWGLIIQ